MGMGRESWDLCGSCAGGIVRRAGAVRPFVDGRATRPWVLALVAIVSCALMVAAAAMPVSAMAVPTVHEAPEQQTVEILADGSARVDGASFGIIGFERLAKGTARASEGAPEGYRLPPEQQTVEILADGSARVDGASFGIIGFERLAKGTARASEGAPEGYRLPISDSAGLVVVRAPGEVLLHVDREVAARLSTSNLGFCRLGGCPRAR